MKKQNFFRKVLSASLVIMIVLSLFLHSSALAKQTPVKTIKVSVDPRIELLTVVQYLVFGSWTMSKLDTNYANEVQEKFGPYWKHPVFNQYFYMWYYYDFCNNVPHDLMLHLSEPPDLDVKISIPKDLVKRAGGEKNLNDFLDFLRDFAKKAKFMDFYEDHRELYEYHVEEVTKQIEKEDYVSLLEGYYGASPNSYALILAILLYEGGYGVNVGGTMYAIIGPSRSEDREPVFADPSYLFNTTFHQFGNSFISPLSSKIIEDIKKCEKLIQPIYKEMEDILYPQSPTWEICLNEHLIRAITIRILAPKNGEEETKKKIKENYDSYFVYIEYVLDMLDEYEKNREEYPNFSDFFPKMQALFEELCEYPLIPTFLKIDYASQNGVQISWLDNSANEVGFQIYKKELDDAEFAGIGKVSPNQTTYRDNHVTIGKTYRYVVSAVGEKGEIVSNQVDITIKSSKPIAPKQLNAILNEEKTKLTFHWEYSFFCDGFKIYETNSKRTLISEIAPDKREMEINIPAIGEHTYIITAWIKTEKDKIVESFDSKPIKIILGED